MHLDNKLAAYTTDYEICKHRPTDLHLQDVAEFLLPIAKEYPGILQWFWGKVVPGIKDGSRKVSVYYRNGELAAVGIAKFDQAEAKICTVRVSPAHVGKGLGVKVFNDLLDWLPTTNPILSVSEERLPFFHRIFQHFGFTLTSVKNGYYREGKAEYFYNEKNLSWNIRKFVNK